ncbi:unnamed protein product [Symbiodinium sp. CCMP2456]|nr:unnamed protein product [Symbiodinium sp. CCMP2456]
MAEDIDPTRPCDAAIGVVFNCLQDFKSLSKEGLRGVGVLPGVILRQLHLLRTNFRGTMETAPLENDASEPANQRGKEAGKRLACKALLMTTFRWLRSQIPVAGVAVLASVNASRGSQCTSCEIECKPRVNADLFRNKQQHAEDEAPAASRSRTQRFSRSRSRSRRRRSRSPRRRERERHREPHRGRERHRRSRSASRSRGAGGERRRRREKVEENPLGDKEMLLDNVVSCSPHPIDIRGCFQDGRPMQELVDKLVLAEADPLRDDFLKLRCVIHQGQIICLDARRLACLQEYARKVQREVTIRVNVNESWDKDPNVSNFLKHYTTVDGGPPKVRWRQQQHYGTNDRDGRRDDNDRERRQPIGQGRGKGGKGQGKKGKRRNRDGKSGGGWKGRKNWNWKQGDEKQSYDGGNTADDDKDSRQGVDDTNEESWNDPNFFDEEDFVSNTPAPAGSAQKQSEAFRGEVVPRRTKWDNAPKANVSAFDPEAPPHIGELL